MVVVNVFDSIFLPTDNHLVYTIVHAARTHTMVAVEFVDAVTHALLGQIYVMTAPVTGIPVAAIINSFLTTDPYIAPEIQCS